MNDNVRIKCVWRTRKLAPTDTRGARIQVTSHNGERRVMPYDHSARDAHETAVREALAVMRPYWTIELVEQVDIAAAGYAFIVEGEMQ
jgi:predicted membrane-bound mannosyltransferase